MSMGGLSTPRVLKSKYIGVTWCGEVSGSRHQEVEPTCTVPGTWHQEFALRTKGAGPNTWYEVLVTDRPMMGGLEALAPIECIRWEHQRCIISFPSANHHSCLQDSAQPLVFAHYGEIHYDSTILWEITATEKFDR